VEVTQETFESDVIGRSQRDPVVVDFWASWCGPCLQLGPVLEAAAEERGLTLAKIDVDAEKELADRYGISGIPAVKAFRHGEVVAEFVGARSRAGVEAFLDELLRPPLAETLDDEELASALRAGDYELALSTLLERAQDPARRDEARRIMVEVFSELGQSHPLATAYRRQLATLLY
jgi:putative thioredoxin